MDIAKAISILLVVLWHIFYGRIAINALMAPLRMPLFFFVSGLFAGRVLAGSWRSVLRGRVLYFYYLYLLWSLIAFAAITVPSSLIAGEAVPLRDLASIPFRPTQTLWFLYALAVVFLLAKLFSRIPPVPLLIGLVLLFCISVSDGEISNASRIDRVARLSLFFFAGTFSFAAADQISRAGQRWWPLLLAAYLGLAWAVLAARLHWIGPVILAVSLLGLVAMLSLSRAIESNAVGAILRVIGQHTIYIFVLHRPILFYYGLGCDAIGLEPGMTRDWISWPVAIGLALAIGAALDRVAPWLFKAPWMIARRQAPALATA